MKKLTHEEIHTVIYLKLINIKMKKLTHEEIGSGAIKYLMIKTKFQKLRNIGNSFLFLEQMLRYSVECFRYIIAIKC